MRVGELIETLKMKALPESSDDYKALTEFLNLYRDAVQLVVDRVWNLDEIPSIKTLHKIFYSELRELGFRAHHAKQIYLYAKAVVRSSKRNNGKKPVLRKLTARLDRANRSSNFNKKLSLWFYRKIQFTISYEALERRLLVSYVNPMNTSSKCSRCGSRLKIIAVE
ncbi:MAG: zinc ribbon domain-containing protein [Sulfolobales archaeon]